MIQNQFISSNAAQLPAANASPSVAAPATPTASFLYVACQIGTESLLKEELRRQAPALRPAFARPGWLTFKLPAGEGRVTPISPLHAIFARQHGLCLGPVDSGAPDDAARAKACLTLLQQGLAAQGAAACTLHIWPANPERIAPAQLTHISSLLQAARPATASSWLSLEPSAAPGALIADLVVLEPAVWWLGLHAKTSPAAVGPGGYVTLAQDPGAPSRAYYKINEAIARFALPMQPGETAVEVGCAPGGTAYALLRRGLTVWGIDRAAMHPAVAATAACLTPSSAGPARWHHIRKAVGEVRRDELPAQVHWLLVDINAHPDTALKLAAPLVEWARPSLRGVIFTLKLTNPAAVQRLSQWRRRLKAWGIGRVLCQQLQNNRQEICMVGLTDTAHGLGALPTGA